MSTWQGIDPATGAMAEDTAHIQHSMRDILTTPLGSRVERRDYGSLVPELIDHPANAANRLRLLACTVMAISRWDNRIAIDRIGFTLDAAGKMFIDIFGTRRNGPRQGSAATFSIMVR